jgi:effector-binding domain-containing protein
LFGPKEVAFSRSIVINADQPKVMTALGDFKFFTEKWSPWTEKDPEMKKTYEGEPGKPGHKYSWEGNDKVGKGTQEFIAITNDSIYQKLNLITWHAEPDVYLTAKPEGAGTKVTWTIVMKNGFFGRGMSLFMNMEKRMAPDFEHGLDMLKKAVEEMPSEPTAANYEVKEIDWADKTFVGKKATLTFEQLSFFFGENFPKIFGELGKAKIQPLMAPSSIFFKYDAQKGEAECAAVACVPAGTKLKDWETFNVPAGKALHVAYYGGYNNMTAPHAAIDEYMKAHNLTQSVVVEEYASDPGTEKDSTKWLTNIYYVLSPF